MQNSNEGMIPAVKLNGNYDITNIVNIQANKERICKTLDTCIGLLSKHAGPYSHYSMLVKRDGGPAEFTRDGISILNSLQFFSPLENHVKNLLVHVGTLVDNSAKDNTTTSMLAAATFIKNLIAQDYVNVAANNRLTPRDVKAMFDEITNDVISNIKTLPTSSIEGWSNLILEYHPGMPEIVAKNKAAGLIAYAQAMSSSGGNVDLAKKLKLVFENCPDVCREYMTYQGTAIETKEEFIVRENDWDARIECAAALPAQFSFNNAIGTEYHDSATTIIIPDAIADRSSLEDELRSYIQTHQEENIVILAQSFSNLLMMDAISSKGRVTLWQYAARMVNGGQQSISELLIIKSTAKPGYRGNDFVAIPEVDVRFSEGRLYLGNYYPEHTDANNAHVHPYYLEYTEAVKDPEKLANLSVEVKEYGAMLEELTGFLKAYHDGRKLDGTAEALYINLLEKLTSYHKLILRVGGSAYTAIANQSVVKDAMGAVMSSLKDGMNTQGLLGITSMMDALRYEYSTNECSKLLFEALQSGLLTTLNAIYNEHAAIKDSYGKVVKYGNILYNPETSVDKIDVGNDLAVNLITKATEDNLDDFIYTYPVVQPIKAVEEMFGRMSDLLCKVICTSEMLVDNSFMTNE